MLHEHFLRCKAPRRRLNLSTWKGCKVPNDVSKYLSRMYNYQNVFQFLFQWFSTLILSPNILTELGVDQTLVRKFFAVVVDVNVSFLIALFCHLLDVTIIIWKWVQILYILPPSVKILFAMFKYVSLKWYTATWPCFRWTKVLFLRYNLFHRTLVLTSSPVEIESSFVRLSLEGNWASFGYRLIILSYNTAHLSIKIKQKSSIHWYTIVVL